MADEERTTETDSETPKTTRASRGSNTREAATRRATSWKPPSVLPEPEPEDGYVFKWIRTDMIGQSDPRNVSMKLREGWEPVTLNEQPTMDIMPEHGTRWDNNIFVGGLLLCKMPKDFAEQREAHYARINSQQIQGVDNDMMREQDEKLAPMLAPDRKTSFSNRQ